MLNNYYYRSIVCQWIWEIFEDCLYTSGHISYKLRVSGDDKVYIECYGGTDFTQSQLNNISTLTGLKLFLPEKVMKFDGTDSVSYSNYFDKTKSCIIIIDDPYFRISNADKNSNKYSDIDLYDDPTCFHVEHFKTLSKVKNYNAKHERRFVDEILFNLYSSYRNAVDVLHHSLHTTNSDSLIYDLKNLTSLFKVTINIPDRVMRALRQSSYYRYVDLSKIRFLLGLHNIDIVSTLGDQDDPIMSYHVELPIDTEAVVTMCEVAKSDINLVKASFTDFDISFLFKDELHKALFANKSYFNQL